ncbi:MAG: hypothetical protein KGH59_01250 [Candidatus Micrarchaeota archaeon]|nr:hypothetical protein [Candidatus Micrarchaeota archaeon]
MRKLLAIVLILLTAQISGAQSVSSANYSVAYASQTINTTLAYIDNVNQSGYLIFYPHLSAAYNYIGEAQKAYRSSPNTAVEYAALAMRSAQEEYSRISSFRAASFAVMSFFTIVSFALMYAVMRRVSVSRARK